MAEVMSTTQMFVGNLPWSVRTKHLEEDFGRYGEVTDAFVAYKGRRSRGFGFVTMAKADEAAKAQKAMDGKQVGEGEQAREMRVTLRSSAPPRTRRRLMPRRRLLPRTATLRRRRSARVAPASPR